MSLRTVREQLGALREEVTRTTGREWIVIKAPELAADEVVEAWLSETLGSDWRRHVILWFGDADCNRPVVVSRMPVLHVDSGFTLRFSAADAAVL